MVGRRVSPTEQAPRCRLELPGAPQGGKGRKGMELGLRWTPEVTLELWEDSTHLLPCPRVDLGGWEGQRLGSEAGWEEAHTYTCGRKRPCAVCGDFYIQLPVALHLFLSHPQDTITWTWQGPGA